MLYLRLYSGILFLLVLSKVANGAELQGVDKVRLVFPITEEYPKIGLLNEKGFLKIFLEKDFFVRFLSNKDNKVTAETFCSNAKQLKRNRGLCYVVYQQAKEDNSIEDLGNLKFSALNPLAKYNSVKIDPRKIEIKWDWGATTVDIPSAQNADFSFHFGPYLGRHLYEGLVLNIQALQATGKYYMLRIPLPSEIQAYSGSSDALFLESTGLFKETDEELPKVDAEEAEDAGSEVEEDGLP